MSESAPADLLHRAPVMQAPVEWSAIDFISDLHLNLAEPATLQAWQDYLLRTRAQAVFILGDLFDVWVGDDSIRGLPAGRPAHASLEQQCAQILQTASRRLTLFVMHGNRDFLMGDEFAKTCGATLIADPTLLVFAGERYLLSHGDALCLDDTDYMQFRAMVRGKAWQHNFLEQSLALRQVIGKHLRAQSEEKKRLNSQTIDLRTDAVNAWLQVNQCQTLIHGHTHRPTEHDLGEGRRRVVLSDWDARATPARTEVLRLHRDLAPAPTPASLRRIDAAHADLM